MHNFFQKSVVQKNKGYTLLFAVLVSSIVLAIGISILNISKKEFLLASSARESTSAFYAADSGLECAMFNNKAGYISTTSPYSVSCVDVTKTFQVDFSAINPSPATSANPATAFFDLKLNDSTCAIVQIDKYYEPSATPGNFRLRTRIISRGYNVGWNEAAGKCNEPSPRRVERALRFTF